MQAVTDDVISEGVVWGTALSSLFAIVSILVFTGSLAITGLATATMACINALVLGLYHVLGWHLGAIEGVSITVLVGLSVDFCIHFSEAFVASPLDLRRDRAKCAIPPPLLDARPLPDPPSRRGMGTRVCRDALMLMGTPVLSSAVSTVATALPLWLTATRALHKFGVVIAISLSVSFVYALLMLIPLLSMFGPQRARHPWLRARAWWRAMWSSALARAALACAVCLGFLVRFPLPSSAAMQHGSSAEPSRARGTPMWSRTLQLIVVIMQMAVPASRRMPEAAPMLWWILVAVIGAALLRGLRALVQRRRAPSKAYSHDSGESHGAGHRPLALEMPAQDLGAGDTLQRIRFREGEPGIEPPQSWPRTSCGCV